MNVSKQELVDRIKQLEKGLSELIEVAHECDSWESFPSDALDDATKTLEGE